MLLNTFKAVVIDVETAFLYGKLDEEIYIEIPPGYNEVIPTENLQNIDCLLLQQAIYGIVQAARQWWKSITKALKDIGFKISEADPYLAYKLDNQGTCMMILYIDDIMVTGTEALIDDAIDHLKQVFIIKEVQTLDDYLGVRIVRSTDKKKLWLGQPSIINSLSKKFKEETETVRKTLTPGTPGFCGRKAQDEASIITVDQQARFKSGVGTLLHLTKHSRPDITNSVRELSKTMDQPTFSQYKEMLKVIKYVLKTHTQGLKIYPI